MGDVIDIFTKRTQTSDQAETQEKSKTEASLSDMGEWTIRLSSLAACISKLIENSEEKSKHDARFSLFIGNLLVNLSYDIFTRLGLSAAVPEDMFVRTMNHNISLLSGIQYVGDEDGGN